MPFETYYAPPHIQVDINRITSPEEQWDGFRAPIGRDPELGITYTLAMDFTVVPMGIPANLELAFYIIEFDELDDIEDNIFDALRARLIIQDNMTRHLCLEVYKTMLHILLKEERPSSVYMQTMVPNLPEKALGKYRTLLTEA